MHILLIAVKLFIFQVGFAFYSLAQASAEVASFGSSFLVLASDEDSVLGSEWTPDSYRRLSVHHSRDSRFLTAIRQEILLAMDRTQAYPWRCPCGSLNGKRAVHCPICTKHWSQGQPHSNQPRNANNAQNRPSKWAQQRADTPRGRRGWNYDADYQAEEQWVQPPRQKSPRQRSGSHRPKKGKPKGSGEQKGGTHPGSGAGAPEIAAHQGPPAVLPTYHEAPWLMAPPPPIPTGSLAAPSSEAAPSATSAAEQKLKAMYALLEKHPEGLHPDIQREIQKAKVQDGEVAIKSLHKQVNALGRTDGRTTARSSTEPGSKDQNW